jgi:hypothetical protein
MPDKKSDFKRTQNQLQWWGAFFGLVIAWTLGSMFPALPARLSWLTVMLWGAAIGAAVFSWRSFEHAGRALTHSENRALNFAIGFSIPAAFLALLTIFLKR